MTKFEKEILKYNENYNKIMESDKKNIDINFKNML